MNLPPYFTLLVHNLHSSHITLTLIPILFPIPMESLSNRAFQCPFPTLSKKQCPASNFPPWQILPNFDKGGQVHLDHGKKALVMIHHGEMVVPKKDVEKTKRAMKKEGVAVPRARKVKHGVVGKGGRIKKLSFRVGTEKVSDSV